MLCHGQGDPAADPFDGGCCHLPSLPDGTKRVCPLRWYIDYSTSTPPGDVGTATIYDSDRNALGTVDDFIASFINGNPKRQRARNMIQGAVYVCGGLATELAENGIPTGANWASELNARWSAIYDPGGAGEAVGDVWVSRNKPRNWCVTYGPSEGHCCFSEDATTNATRATVLHVDRVTIASRDFEA